MTQVTVQPQVLNTEQVSSLSASELFDMARTSGVVVPTGSLDTPHKEEAHQAVEPVLTVLGKLGEAGLMQDISVEILAARDAPVSEADASILGGALVAFFRKRRDY